MEVILVKRIHGLGDIGSTVKVKGGFGRNYLLPRGIALRNNAENQSFFEAQKAEYLAKNNAEREKALALQEKLGELSIHLSRQASEEGRLFGSVRSQDIIDSLNTQVTEYFFEKEQIILSIALKNVGIYDLKIRLHSEIFVPLKVTITRLDATRDLDD